MSSELIKAVAWALVEMDDRQPRMRDIRAVLELALLEATRLESYHEVRKTNLIRLTNVMGGYRNGNE